MILIQLLLLKTRRRLIFLILPSGLLMLLLIETVRTLLIQSSGLLFLFVLPRESKQDETFWSGLAPFGSLPVQLQRALHLIEERDIAEEMVLCRS